MPGIGFTRDATAVRSKGSSLGWLKECTSTGGAVSGATWEEHPLIMESEVKETGAAASGGTDDIALEENTVLDGLWNASTGSAGGTSRSGTIDVKTAQRDAAVRNAHKAATGKYFLFWKLESASQVAGKSQWLTALVQITGVSQKNPKMQPVITYTGVQAASALTVTGPTGITGVLPSGVTAPTTLVIAANDFFTVADN